MAVKSVGNRAKGYLGHSPSGIGSANVPVGIGWSGWGADASGDVKIVQLSALIFNDLHFGIFFQSSVPITVEFTLSNPGMAMDPDPNVQGSVLWGNSLSVPAGEITKADVLFTCCKITWSAAGEAYMGVR